MPAGPADFCLIIISFNPFKKCKMKKTTKKLNLGKKQIVQLSGTDQVLGGLMKPNPCGNTGKGGGWTCDSCISMPGQKGCKD